MNTLFNPQLVGQMVSPNTQQNQPFDPDKFQRMIPNLNNNLLQQVIQQARSQGIPENKIQEGLNYINSLR